MNVSPAPDTSIVSCGLGDSYNSPLYSAPCLPKVVIILVVVKFGLLLRSDSFNFTNVKFSIISFDNLRLLSKMDNIDFLEISFIYSESLSDIYH